MGRHRNALAIQSPVRDAGSGLQRRPIRRTSSLPVFASFAALAFVLVSVTSPISQNEAAVAAVMEQIEQAPTQQLAVAGDYQTGVVRDSYGVTAKPVPGVVAPPPVTPAASASGGGGGGGAPAAGTPDPGSAKAIAFDMVAARGWGVDQYNCLVSLWQKESGWNTFANNPSSGAYGIPQSLPGSKMATAGSDWATNPATQITWGLGYISGRYGNPCGAWGASQAKGWY